MQISNDFKEPDPEIVRLIFWILLVFIFVFIIFWFYHKFVSYPDIPKVEISDWKTHSEPFQLSQGQTELSHLEIEKETPSIQYFEKNYCGNCNIKREPNDVFCSNCGGQLQ